MLPINQMLFFDVDTFVCSVLCTPPSLPRALRQTQYKKNAVENWHHLIWDPLLFKHFFSRMLLVVNFENDQLALSKFNNIFFCNCNNAIGFRRLTFRWLQ
jgi:hypothetical protein